MRFVAPLVSTLALGTILGVIAAPVLPKVEADMVPSDLQYADTLIEREDKK
jgi:hypothetical protein